LWSNFIQENSLPNKPKTISKILSATANFGRLNHHINQIRQFEERLRKLLPAPVDEDYNWSVGNYRDQHLTLFAENQGLATRLRFQQQLFLESSRAVMPEIQTISIKILYQGLIKDESNKRGRSLSLEAARGIADFAEHIDDSELKAALQRLSKRAGSK
jgi:hypothetical protein